jgi:importin subunit alpha-6/7
MEIGAIPHLVQLLSSPNHDVREQSAWCLGNVAGDGPVLRDYALQCGALAPLLLNVSHPENISLLRNCTWSLSNFCRGKPQPSMELVRQALPMLGGIITSCTDQETVVDATWALSYMSDGDNSRIQEVVSLGLVPALVKVRVLH